MLWVSPLGGFVRRYSPTLFKYARYASVRYSCYFYNMMSSSPCTRGPNGRGARGKYRNYLESQYVYTLAYNIAMCLDGEGLVKQ